MKLRVLISVLSRNGVRGSFGANRRGTWTINALLVEVPVAGVGSQCNSVSSVFLPRYAAAFRRNNSCCLRSYADRVVQTTAPYRFLEILRPARAIFFEHFRPVAQAGVPVLRVRDAREISRPDARRAGLEMTKESEREPRFW